MARAFFPSAHPAEPRAKQSAEMIPVCDKLSARQNENSSQGIVITGEQGFIVLAGLRRNARSSLIVFPGPVRANHETEKENTNVTDKTIHC